MIFQPHRYTRTRDLFEDFVKLSMTPSTVEVLDIYAASEEPIEGVTAPALVAAISREGVEYAPSSEHAIAQVIRKAQPNDAILTLGAGNVSQIAPQVLEKLGQFEPASDSVQ